jgi:hypothetical protein
MIPASSQAYHLSDMALPQDHSSSHSPASPDKDTQPQYTRSHNGLNGCIEADALDELNLPFRSATAEPNIQTCTTETLSGNILCEMQSNRTDRTERYKVVTFTVGDPENPKNWGKPFKWWCTMVVAFTCFTVALNSAIITADIRGPAKEFGVSEEVSLLAVSMFVVGFGIGPMVFAPMSEILGRRTVYATTLFVAVIFIIPCAVATNVATLVVCRLIDGIAFSAPMTLGAYSLYTHQNNSVTDTFLVGGTLADLWRAEERGVPMAAFSAAPFLGPTIGPLSKAFRSYYNLKHLETDKKQLVDISRIMLAGDGCTGFN